MSRQSLRVAAAIALVMLTACGKGPKPAIHAGMQEQEVLRVLGRPSEVQGPPLDPTLAPSRSECQTASIAKAYVYSKGKGEATFVYFDQEGRVVCSQTAVYVRQVHQ